ncbi:TIR domain-containing protein [Rhizobium grahamii]|uniref:TIR domain-containing protein n=1 Tax=Rhizobium grahamii TaxID=1120045 RepID=A0A5Q0C3M5_9HYPH|nr:MULTISPECIES: TIR domain-containing protein [Rhizobium]QFY60486.1 TIR domain-containing protein [Rhizobium grahamii]QRM50386.1 TIR domain-containing protein [Rhizobium sp. BG6]
MADIFISHAVADKALAEKLVTFLKEAIGVPSNAIFCSSVDGHGIPLGDDFNKYMKDQIQKPKLVILLMTPRYMESWFCLMEVGAAWAISLNPLPIVVPPVQFNVIASTLGLKQGWKIDDHAKLIDLRAKIKETGIVLEPRSEHDWERKRTAWKADLGRLLKSIAKPTSVTAADHESVKQELEELRQQYSNLEEEYQAANETIEELKAAKDPAAVKAIMQKKSGFDAEARFDELIENVSRARPKISIWFYRSNVLMDRYGKAATIDPRDQQQKADMEAAIQYNLADPDVPHDFLWKGTKLKRVASAMKELEEFLESPEAQEFVKSKEAQGISMEPDDLDFWEQHIS